MFLNVNTHLCECYMYTCTYIHTIYIYKHIWAIIYSYVYIGVSVYMIYIHVYVYLIYINILICIHLPSIYRSITLSRCTFTFIYSH